MTESIYSNEYDMRKDWLGPSSSGSWSEQGDASSPDLTQSNPFLITMANALNDDIVNGSIYFEDIDWEGYVTPEQEAFLTASAIVTAVYVAHAS